MLRGINVAGRNKIRMSELKDLYESIGFNNVKTYIQSGNVIFNYHKNNSTSELEERIKIRIKEAFGYNVDVFIRTIDEIQKIIKYNPFHEYDVSKLHITFLSETSNLKSIKDIDKVKDELEEYLLYDKEIYLFLPNGYARTKLSNNFFEKKLKLNATTRNLRTVNKLFEIAQSLSTT